MRVIYADEAGTSNPARYTVVAAILVDRDTQRDPMLRQLQQLYDQAVPQQYRKNFVFHAKTLFDPDLNEHWPYVARQEFVRRMVSIPSSQNNLGFAWAAASRAWDPPHLEGTEGVSPDDLRHAHVFSWCLAAADNLMRRAEDETAEVLSDAFQNKAQTARLQKTIDLLKTRPLIIPSEWRTTREQDRLSGNTSEDLEVTIERILDKVRFVPKGSEPLVEIADACAWSIRRYLDGHADAEPYVRAIFNEAGPRSRLNIGVGHRASSAFVMRQSEQRPFIDIGPFRFVM